MFSNLSHAFLHERYVRTRYASAPAASRQTCRTMSSKPKALNASSPGMWCAASAMTMTTDVATMYGKKLDSL